MRDKSKAATSQNENPNIINQPKDRCNGRV